MFDKKKYYLYSVAKINEDGGTTMYNTFSSDKDCFDVLKVLNKGSVLLSRIELTEKEAEKFKTIS